MAHTVKFERPYHANMDSGSAVRVLHVDDEPSFADMVSTFLEREYDRISVQTATSDRNDDARAATRSS